MLINSKSIYYPDLDYLFILNNLVKSWITSDEIKDFKLKSIREIFEENLNLKFII